MNEITEYPDFSGNQDRVLPILRQLKALDEQKVEAEKVLKGIVTKRLAVEQEAFLTMEAEVIQSIGLDGILFFRKTGEYFSPKKELTEEAHRWLKDNDFGDLFKETVNSRTLNSELRRAKEEDGKEIPEELFNHTTINQIGRRKQTTK